MTYTGLLTTQGLFSTLIFSSTGSGRSVVNRLWLRLGPLPHGAGHWGRQSTQGGADTELQSNRGCFLNNDWMWMWWVYSNYNKLLNIRHESKISLYWCRRTVKTTVKRKKKLPTPQKNPSKQTKQHLNTQQIKIKLGLFSFQKPCSKYFTLKVQLELFRVLVCI